jgi:hypothetical protein
MLAVLSPKDIAIHLKKVILIILPMDTQKTIACLICTTILRDNLSSMMFKKREDKCL